MVGDVGRWTALFEERETKETKERSKERGEERGEESGAK